MHIVIMGAGVAGVASAYYLQKLGHKITVIDRQPGPALETSKANAGQLSYGYTTPWAAPNIPWKAMRWLLRKHSPLILKFDKSFFQLQWLGQMLANCTARRYRLNKDRMVQLSEYSKVLFEQFRKGEDLDFEGREKGMLQLFRQQKEVAAVATDVEILRDYGVACELLDGEQCARVEPALNLEKVVAGLYLPEDACGDCYLFTSRLAQLCQQRGVEFFFNRAIDRLETNKGQVVAVHCGKERYGGDVFLCALGSYSRPLLRQINLRLPIYPVKGYSLTVPIIAPERSPRATIIDETYKVAITRFDERLRVGGMAELAGYDLSLAPQHRETLAMVLEDLFPAAGDVAAADFWCGLRPMTPDSTPIVGPVSSWSNLFLNTGHGTLGWTMSLGSARLVADLIHGREPELDNYQSLALGRYGR